MILFSNVHTESNKINPLVLLMACIVLQVQSGEYLWHIVLVFVVFCSGKILLFLLCWLLSEGRGRGDGFSNYITINYF